MLPTAITAPAVVTVTSEQRLEALLLHTADLDKAQALQQSIPQWLIAADLSVVQGLKTALEQSQPCYTKATQVLARLKPLDEFCKQELTSKLKEKWSTEVDVERDTLEIIKSKFNSTGLAPIGFLEGTTTTSRSLLQAAMENFTSAETRTGGIPTQSLIKINDQPQSGSQITPGNFATLCRELDLGTRYQTHINDVLKLPAKPVADAPVDVRASTSDIRQLKLLDMQVAAHIAYLKKHISKDAYTMLLSVIEQNLPAAQCTEARFDGAAVIWQGLTVHDCCICSALIFSKASIDTAPLAKCVVYMPNEPRRPLYEYPSLKDFNDYLELHLQSKSYKKHFVEHYLPGPDKSDFFTHFNKDRKLGTLVAMPVDTGVADFLFSAFLSKTQKDARNLAVPTADVDEQQREKNIQALLDAGLLLLNAAAFFVPVIGQVMLTAAVVEIVSEVYEGVQDWSHGEHHQALSHLLNVVESLAQMAAFAAGGKIVSAAISKGVKEQAAFFDGFEAVTRADGKARLWKPDLEPYRQASTQAADLQADSQGIYRDGELTSISLDGASYRVSRNAAQQTWQINHPGHSDRFQPAIERTLEGGWRHAYEHAHEWPDGAYALRRTAPRLSDLGDDLTAIADITGMSPASLHRLHESNLNLPQRFNDCVERFRLNRRVNAVISAMEQGETANTDYVQEQLQTLPRLPGWPAERFIEVLGEGEGEGEAKGNVSRFPQTASAVDKVNCLEVTQAELDSGRLLDRVISDLHENDVEALIGSAQTATKSQLLAGKIAAHLKSDRQPLLDWLYSAHDGTATGDVATLREQFPDLPNRVSQELLDNASARDRTFLKERRIGLDLAQQARETQFAIRQDRALAGLHQPQLANADTDNLALRLMDQLQGWDDDLRLEVRQDSESGTLLDSVGKEGASQRKIIVKTSGGYQVTSIDGASSHSKTSRHLVESIYHALPQSQRTRMSFTGVDTVDIHTLRSRLFAAAALDPQRTGKLLRNERSEVAQHLTGCTQADPPAAGSYARALVRKVRKLYPTFTDAQVSAFLDEAGSDMTSRVTRLKELKQQLKAFLKGLYAWRDDEVQMAKLPGQLNDIRVGRRHVANAIENCWRRVTPPRWPQDPALTTLKLEGEPVGQLPTLTEQDVAHVRILSIKDMQAGDELAYFLKPFKNLTRLDLDRNKLTRLPEALSHMPALQHLSLDGNQVALTEHTLRKLADMRELRTLRLTGNRLGATLDVGKMFNLQALYLNDTYATEFPLGIGSLPNLDMVDLRGNEIRELPQWVFQLPDRVAQAINLRLNPLSTASRASLITHRDATGQGMGFIANDEAMINEQRARDLWIPKSTEELYASRNRTWLALKNEPAAGEFFRLLAQVAGTADTRHVREDMTRRVWTVIDAAQADSALREQLLPMAMRANCSDSAAIIFSKLEVAVEVDKVVRQAVNAHDRAARLLQLGRRLFRQDYLSKIAKEEFTADPKLDPVEVELAYLTGLAERLDLIGQPKHMRYASLAGVTPAKLDAAYNRVVSAELAPGLVEFLSKRPFWSDFLREHHPRQFTDAATPFHPRVQTAFENQETLGENYRKKVDGIMAEMQKAESQLLQKLTREAIKAEDLKTCFALD